MVRLCGYLLLSLALAITAALIPGPVAQTPLASPKTQRVQSTAADIRPDKVLADLKARGIDPLSPGSPEKLRRAYTAYEFQAGEGNNLNSNQAEISNALGKLNESLTASSLMSHVKVRTGKPGARVWYELVGSSKSSPFNQLTNNSEDDLPIGIYFMWSQRGERVTSSKLIPFRIIQTQTSVDLEESR